MADNTTLRLLYLHLPGTLSFGSILSQLGLPAPDAGNSDFVTLSNATLKYVPVVNNQTCECHIARTGGAVAPQQLIEQCLFVARVSAIVPRRVLAMHQLLQLLILSELVRMHAITLQWSPLTTSRTRPASCCWRRLPCHH